MVSQAQTTLNLSSKEKTAVRDFLRTVSAIYGEKIQYSALFGSRVRGDSLKDSDIDILLIVIDDHWTFQQAICKISSEIALKYNVTLDVRIISKARWQYYADIQAGQYQNISKEAVPFKVSIKRPGLLIRRVD